MAVSISQIAPARGTPYGGQSITITGSGFGSAQGSVTIEGRPCPIVSWSATSVVFTTPRRMTGDAMVWGGGVVPLVLTTSGAEQGAGSYEYTATITERAFKQLRDSLASLRVQDGAFFAWSPPQVRPIKLDQLTMDNGAAFPQAIVYEIDGQPLPDQSPHGFLVSRHNGIMQAVMPLATMDDFDFQLDQLLADLYMGLMLNSSQGGVVISSDITGFDKGRIAGPSDSSMGVASLTFTLEIQTAYNDFTKNHGYTVT